MDMIKDRVLAYNLATIVETTALEEVAGGITIHMPTLKATGYDIATFDMGLDQ